MTETEWGVRNDRGYFFPAKSQERAEMMVEANERYKTHPKLYVVSRTVTYSEWKVVE